jgi:hypothetical protein
VDQLGFTKVAEVPEGDKLGFVILVKGDAELMIQSTASIEKDNRAMAEYARPAACLYVEVSDFADLLKCLGTAPVVVPIRTTFYGMMEIGVREPGATSSCPPQKSSSLQRTRGRRGTTSQPTRQHCRAALAAT